MAKRKRRAPKQHLNGATMKRKKVRHQFCNLPPDILCSIMSQLQIKEAVRTSVLSSQWKHIWCCHTNLVFDFSTILGMQYYCRNFNRWDTRPRHARLFIRRVDAILRQHNGAGVEKIQVEFAGLKNEHAHHIDGWVKFAIAARTKHLVLDFSHAYGVDEPYNFPFHLFDEAANSACLQNVMLRTISLKQPAADFKGFLNLKNLMLLDVRATDEGIQHLLTNCNVLEFLWISKCNMIKRFRTTHASNQLRHLRVNRCALLEEIELNSGLAKLEYNGHLIPLAPPGTLSNLCVRSDCIGGAHQYIFTELPSTLPRLEMLTLKCREIKRPILPDKPLKFIYLKHMRLELTFFHRSKRTTDALDFACILEAAPFMEKLEFHMWMDCDHLAYCKAHGKLRSLPPCPHYHLKLVDITGFYGQKDQLELALHILRNSVVLEAMKINPKPVVTANVLFVRSDKKIAFVDGSTVAMKYLRRKDHRNVVDVLEVLPKDVENVSCHSLLT